MWCCGWLQIPAVLYIFLYVPIHWWGSVAGVRGARGGGVRGVATMMPHRWIQSGQRPTLLPPPQAASGVCSPLLLITTAASTSIRTLTKLIRRVIWRTHINRQRGRALRCRLEGEGVRGCLDNVAPCRDRAGLRRMGWLRQQRAALFGELFSRPPVWPDLAPAKTEFCVKLKGCSRPEREVEQITRTFLPHPGKQLHVHTWSVWRGPGKRRTSVPPWLRGEIIQALSTGIQLVNFVVPFDGSSKGQESWELMVIAGEWIPQRM